jgi:hypothetical protein
MEPQAPKVEARFTSELGDIRRAADDEHAEKQDQRYEWQDGCRPGRDQRTEPGVRTLANRENGKGQLQRL